MTGGRAVQRQSGRVLVAVDQIDLRDQLATQLAAVGHRVATTRAGADIEWSMQEHQPQVLVLGLAEDIHGMGLVTGKRVRVTTSTPFVFVGRGLAATDRLAGYEAGAEDVIDLPCPPAELAARLAVVLRRHADDINVFEFDDVLVDDRAHLVVRDGKQVGVTSIEFALLRSFMLHRGQVMSKTQLLEQVWGYEHYDVNLVEVHVSALRRKLEAFGPRIVQTVRGVGYVLRADAAAQLATAS